METGQEALTERIRKIISEKIILTDRPAEVDDGVVSGLDSIGRLTLLVELENTLDAELMGPEMGPEVFSSMQSLANYISRKTGAGPSS